MEFVSVFEEAGRDHEAEALDHRLTAASVEAQQVWPFLALAQSEEEFGHRLALRQDTLSAIAAKYEVPLDQVVGPLQRGFEALNVEAKGLVCRRCHHSNAPHTDGAVCPCGCTTFSPKATASLDKEADRGPSYDPDSINDLPLSGTKSNPAYYYNEGYDHGQSGAEYRGYGGRDMAILYGHGYKHGKADAGKTSSWQGHLSRLHQALMDGQDPLTWIQQQAPPPAQTPTHHDTTEEFIGPDSGNRNARDQALEQAGTGSPQSEHHDKQSSREGSLPF